MRKPIIRIAMPSRFVLAASAIVLAASAVSCRTSATPDKSAGLIHSNRRAAANQPAMGTNVAKPAFTGYYSCGMHPEVRSLDPDGKCPICQMPLLPADTVLVVDPVSGKTNTAAAYPVVSGYYSCPMHPTVFSDEPDGKCPICNMPLLSVENPIFRREK
jgi:hypothetical protein